MANDVNAEAPMIEKTPTKRPVLLGIAILLSAMLWLAPFVGMNMVLLPAKLGIIAPDQKVALVGVVAAVGAIVGLLSNIFFGALSDLTRSKLGRRTPWMILGSVGSFAAVCLIISTTNPLVLIIGWGLFQFFLNAIVAPLVTVIPDRVPEDKRGTFSSVYGFAMMVGGAIGSIAASRFVADPNTGMMVLGVLVLLCGPVFAILAPDRSNKGEPREAFSAKMILHNFSFPVKNSRDFYLALIGKLFYVVGTSIITGFQLYILMDYMQASAEAAGNVIAVMSMINLLLGAIFAAISGPISDKVGRRKIFVIAAAGILAVGVLAPYFFPFIWAMYVFAGAVAVGGGIFNAVDQAINYDVLPDPETAAKDLGILNMANTGGQIIGPGLGSILVGALGFGSLFLASAGAMFLSGFAIKLLRKSR